MHPRLAPAEELQNGLKTSDDLLGTATVSFAGTILEEKTNPSLAKSYPLDCDMSANLVRLFANY